MLCVVLDADGALACLHLAVVHDVVEVGEDAVVQLARCVVPFG